MPSHPNLPQRKRHRLDPALYAKTEYDYFFTVCARHKGEPFRNADLAKEVIESLHWTKRRYQWHLYCYCLMPDHLHFVCRLTDSEVKLINAGARGTVPEGVLEHLGRFKSYTTSRAWKLGFHGQLWQKGSYDRVLDLEWALLEIIEYILDNPVRRGMVTDWTEWPYSKIVDMW